MDSSANCFFPKDSNPIMSTSAEPSRFDRPPSLHCQRLPGQTPIQHLRTPLERNDCPDITEKSLMVNEASLAMERGTERWTADPDMWGVKTKRDQDLKWQQKFPTVKKTKSKDRRRRQESGYRGRKRNKDREELKEELGELKERLRTLQEKVCKALNKKRNKENLRDDQGFPREVGLDVIQSHCWNDDDAFSCDDDGEAKFAQLLKLELGSAVARVIDRVLQLYIQTSESTSSEPSAVDVSLLDERERIEFGSQVNKKVKKVDDKDNRIKFGGELIEMAGFSEMFPPQQNLHQLVPPVCRSEPPPLLASQPSPLPSSSFVPPPPSPHLGPLPLLSMQDLFSRSFSQPTSSLSKGFALNAEVYAEMARPLFNPPLPMPLPIPGMKLPEHSERRVDLGVRGGAMDLYFTPGSQEGLTPCHLKKAKLMFFYTRYPSSSTLKTYFPDVKFKRCVTSQMIKWFSNFREFFYIQMERFARQAVKEALTLDGGAHGHREHSLRVDHSTELYRVLNMHYNKSNVYQVPSGFIRVCEVALREFYAAIWTGRDSDPSWKKIIYKMVCKLDGPVPDAFLLPGCPLG